MTRISKYPRLSISVLHKVMEFSFVRAMQERNLDITGAQELVLRALRFEGGLTQTELASRVGQDRNNLSRTLSILRKKGLISKKTKEDDRRYYEVSITPEGEKIHQNIFEVMEEWRENVLFKNMEIEEIVEFNNTLKKLVSNLRENHFTDG